MASDAGSGPYDDVTFVVQMSSDVTQPSTDVSAPEHSDFTNVAPPARQHFSPPPIPQDDDVAAFNPYMDMRGLHVVSQSVADRIEAVEDETYVNFAPEGSETVKSFAAAGEETYENFAPAAGEFYENVGTGGSEMLRRSSSAFSGGSSVEWQVEPTYSNVGAKKNEAPEVRTR